MVGNSIPGDVLVRSTLANDGNWRLMAKLMIIMSRLLLYEEALRQLVVIAIGMAWRMFCFLLAGVVISMAIQ
jgi:hypothetical protein